MGNDYGTITPTRQGIILRFTENFESIRIIISSRRRVMLVCLIYAYLLLIYWKPI